MTRMTGPDCAVMCNLINTHTHTHTSRLIRGFRNKLLRKASAACVNRRLLRYYLIVRLLPNVFALACRS